MYAVVYPASAAYKSPGVQMPRMGVEFMAVAVATMPAPLG